MCAFVSLSPKCQLTKNQRKKKDATKLIFECVGSLSQWNNSKSIEWPSVHMSGDEKWKRKWIYFYFDHFICRLVIIASHSKLIAPFEFGWIAWRTRNAHMQRHQMKWNDKVNCTPHINISLKIIVSFHQLNFICKLMLDLLFRWRLLISLTDRSTFI